MQYLNTLNERTQGDVGSNPTGFSNLSTMYFLHTLRFEVRTSVHSSTEISFSVFSNLPNVLGLSIKDAFYNWVHRTTDYSPESFIKYVRSKNTGHEVYKVDEVPVAICLNCKNYFIGSPVKCKCGSHSFDKTDSINATMALNFYK